MAPGPRREGPPLEEREVVVLVPANPLPRCWQVSASYYPAPGSLGHSAAIVTLPHLQHHVSAYMCVALHSYVAHGPDELELQKGEGVRVFGKDHDGWLRGMSLVTGRVGIFPSNYVAPLFRKSNLSDSKMPSLYTSWTLSTSSLSSQGSISENGPRQSRPLKPALLPVPVTSPGRSAAAAASGQASLRRGRGSARKRLGSRVGLSTARAERSRAPISAPPRASCGRQAAPADTPGLQTWSDRAVAQLRPPPVKPALEQGLCKGSRYSRAAAPRTGSVILPLGKGPHAKENAISQDVLRHLTRSPPSPLPGGAAPGPSSSRQRFARAAQGASSAAATARLGTRAGESSHAERRLPNLVFGVNAPSVCTTGICRPGEGRASSQKPDRSYPRQKNFCGVSCCADTGGLRVLVCWPCQRPAEQLPAEARLRRLAASPRASPGASGQARGDPWELRPQSSPVNGAVSAGLSPLLTSDSLALSVPLWIPADLPPSNGSCSPDGSLQRPGQAGTPVPVAGSLRRPPTAAARPQQFQLYQHVSPQPHSVPPGAGTAEAGTRPSFSHDASPALVVRGGESRTPSVCSSVILDAKDPPAKSEAAPKPPASAPPSILVKPDTSRNSAEKQVKTVRFQNHSPPPPKRHSLQPSPSLPRGRTEPAAAAEALLPEASLPGPELAVLYSPRASSSPLHQRRALHPKALSLDLSGQLTFPVKKNYSSISAN
ncbi:hypothetical protein QYF61_008185 [Mycteria americana]|uniref:SH3 domain-containing protein n=1 Tax=Mycteria americana TaxID=33587 RepID=A0AAN7NER8_MYCAM|nr:hypothetical protein QYF61_008185 [Mycteria americana]